MIVCHNQSITEQKYEEKIEKKLHKKLFWHVNISFCKNNDSNKLQSTLQIDLYNNCMHLHSNLPDRPVIYENYLGLAFIKCM